MPRKIKKVPTVLQMEAVECGAASLTMILAYFKKYVALEEVREKCGVTRDGSKASNLLKAARSYGLNAKGQRIDAAAVDKLKMPAIIHWNMNHFLVLEGCYKNTYYLNDPAAGRRSVDLETFNKSFTGIAMVFEKSEAFEPSGKKQRILGALWSQFEKYKFEMFYISFTGFMTIMPAVFVAWLAKIFLDDIWLNGRTKWLSGLLMVLVIVAILKGLTSTIYKALNYRMLEKIRLSDTSRLIWKIIHLPARFFMQRYAGEVSARVKNAEQVADFMAVDLVNALAHGMALVVFGLVLFTYNGFLAALVLILFIINMFVLAINAKVQENINNKISMSYMKLMGASISSIQLIETIKSTSTEQAFFEKWSGYQGKLINEKQEAAAKVQNLVSLPSLIAMTAAVVVLYAGGYLIINGRLTVGTLAAFQSIMAGFFASSTVLNQAGFKLPKIIADIKRIEDIKNYPDEMQKEDSREGEKAKCFSSCEGNLKVENVTFGFSPYDPPLIQDFSLEVKSGQRVALVGGSGSGKSTIAKLIVGIHKPWSGQILMDNKSIEELPKSVVNRSMAMVNQEIVLFEGTISENISLWQEDIDEAKLIQAAKNACIHEEIVCRAGGYQHQILEEGQNFSGGQRQRLEIARAFLEEPSIMILDEATSALDPETELKIDQNLRKGGYTCIIVAHRLSTIRDCDEIIVLDKGKVVQRGTHDSLLEEEGLYRELIKTM